MGWILLAKLSAPLVLSGLVLSVTAAGGRTAASARAVVKVAYNRTLKAVIVVDGRGWTLYMFTADKGGSSNCRVDIDPLCPQLWRPLTTTGAPQAGTGIKGSLLGTTKRTNGSQQVTYNRHPLYYFHGSAAFAGDKKPGDVEGQDFDHFFFVLSSKGTPIHSTRP